MYYKCSTSAMQMHEKHGEVGIPQGTINKFDPLGSIR